MIHGSQRRGKPASLLRRARGELLYEKQFHGVAIEKPAFILCENMAHVAVRERVVNSRQFLRVGIGAAGDHIEFRL